MTLSVVHTILGEKEKVEGIHLSLSVITLLNLYTVNVDYDVIDVYSTSIHISHWIEGTSLPPVLYNEWFCSILSKIHGQQNKIPMN